MFKIFANCFETIMVEKSYFHLEQIIKYKSLSKKKQLKEDANAEGINQKICGCF